MTLGEKIHLLRTQNNMTMEELASLLGVQRSAVNKYEKGAVVNLKRSTILKLCQVFNVPSSYFLDDDQDLTVEEHRLIILYRNANDQARSDAIDLLERHQKKDASGSGQTA